MPDVRRFLDDGRPPGFAMGDYTLTLEVGLMGEDYERLAAQELRETPEVVDQALQELKALLKGEEGLYVPLDDDYEMLMFLRPCKFYAQSAFERMKTYYKFSHKNPKLGMNLTPLHNPAVFKHDMLCILPKRDQHGRRILLLEGGGKWPTDAVTTTDIHRALWLVLKSAALEPRTQVAGALVIIDMRGLTMRHVLQISPAFALHLTQWVQECIPLRLKAVHIVRQPYVFNIMFAIFKPFLQQKLRNRIHFHGNDWQSLHQHIHPSSLPKQFGGDLDIPEGTAIKLYQTLCSFEEEFEEHAKYGYQK